MATWTIVTDPETAAEAVVTESLMRRLRDNPEAIREGDASAPAFGAGVIDTTQIAAAAVGRSEIANSTTTSAGTFTGGTPSYFTLNDWALFPMIHSNNVSVDIQLTPHITDGGSGLHLDLGYLQPRAGHTMSITAG